MSTSALTTTAPTTTTTTPAPAEPVHEIPQWLKSLPVAPEYHPTVAEFQDPIAYILKIENEASQFGICKIVPPVPLPSKKATITNLNRSLSARNPNNNVNNNKSPPTFTTRHQQVGFDPRKGRPVQKPVWQSGESYTLQQFEAKAKQFEKVYLKKSHGKRGSTLSALEIETLFWRASVDKPFSVEYANDMPGSAFVPINTKAMRELGDAATVGETAWNMRGVARSNGSLLRFMKEEIPGVTSPMVYIAMLFSWFAWHVEDHDLHSLNYMHMGSAKTWYGVPRDAAFAFQEVVRVHGYGGDFNPLVTFATLGEKTTVMSPEVLVGGGLPCCRLVQNVGEFVVTFPGAYHSGFSHGFNCGEASNIATPGWLRFAKEAAVRRASINCPPMVSHFQLLYALALTFCSRVPMSLSQEPRSSRLKDKKRGEGERMVKECFLQSVIQNNDLLHILSSHGFSCVLLPQNTSEVSLLSNTCIGTQKKIKPVISVGVGSNTEASEASTVLFSDETKLGTNVRLRSITGFDSVNETSKPVFRGDRVGSLPHHCNVDLSTTVIGSADMEKDTNYQGTGLLDHGRFPCVQCGILSFACVAVIQPREAASQCFMSADCSFFNDWKVGSGFLKDTFSAADENETFEPNCSSGAIKKAYQGGLYDVPVQTSDYQVQVSDEMVDVVSRTGSQRGISSLDLLVSAYGESSESDEELVEPDMVVNDDNIAEHKQFEDRKTFLWKTKVFPGDSRLRSHGSDHQDGMSEYMSDSSSKPGSEDEVSVQISPCTSSFVRKRRWIGSEVKVESHLTSNSSLKIDEETLASRKLKRLVGSYRDKGVFSGRVITGSAKLNETGLCTNQLDSVPVDTRMPSNTLCARPKFSLLGEKTKCSNIDIPIPDTNTSLMQISQEESSRKHIFCLEHAVEVEKQLRPIGGASILLLCHPEYPKVEAEAKVLAEDMGIDYLWKDILFRDATKEDQERISFALDDKEVEPSNGDWAVKLGINLYYSVHLSKSPLYTKQMPYNSIIYKAFRFSSPTNYPMEVEVSGKVPNKQKKTLVAGKWCGKVWMLNQVHPSLAQRETQEEENSSSYHARAVPCLKSCSMLGRKAEMSNQLKEPVNCPTRCSPGVTTTIDGKFGQKQKRKFVEEPTMKRKLPLLGSPAQTEDSSQSDSSPVSGRRCLKKGHTKHDRPLLQRSSVKNIRQFDSNLKVEIDGGPSTRLRRRPSKLAEEVKVKPVIGKQTRTKVKKTPPSSNDIEDEEAEYQCDIDGCTMGFTSKQELTLHKRNICSVKGCGKNFFSHKYLVQHRRVHLDDRPLKCPWKGCKMTFKWAWARTEHIRVHTGARPYICREVGCGQTFRFVSDFSRHKRKTGHSVKG